MHHIHAQIGYNKNIMLQGLGVLLERLRAKMRMIVIMSIMHDVLCTAYENE